LVGMSYIWSADTAVPSGSRTMRKLGLGASAAARISPL
jgi:hypothetical protein